MRSYECEFRCVRVLLPYSIHLLCSGAILVLHTPIIKYVFEIYLGIKSIAVGKNGKENMEGLKMVQLSTVIDTLLYSTLLDELLVKVSILYDFLVFYS